jgi:bifunctional enzyme CysN/CysC
VPYKTNKTYSLPEITGFLDRDQNKDLLRFLTAGSVNNGKSTLTGRLLYDSCKLYEDQLSALLTDSFKKGQKVGDIDFSLLTDGLKAEREQGITIDVAYRYFSTARRKFIMADTPGHDEYTRNMVTGASTANLAIILIDATRGVTSQTRRHSYLVSLLGINHIVVAVNKMDLVDYSHGIFNDICGDYQRFVKMLEVRDVYYIPISALKGENVTRQSQSMPWYHGKSILRHLETVNIIRDYNFSDLRYPVQYVLRSSDGFKGFAGRIASGVIRKGDIVAVLPSFTTSRVKSVITCEGEKDYAFTPQSATITLEDDIDIFRGDMMIHPLNTPCVQSNFKAILFWMDENPSDLSTSYFLKHTTATVRTKIDEIRYRSDINTLSAISVGKLNINDIGQVIISTGSPLFFDPYRKNHRTGSFVLIDPVTYNTCAAGIIIS